MNVFINHNQNTHFEILFSILNYLLNSNTNIIFNPPIKLSHSNTKRIILKKDYINSCKYKLGYFKKIDKLEIDNMKENEFDFCITTTIYPYMFDELVKYKNNIKYLFICHTIDDCYNDWNNVYYHTPLAKRYFIPDFFPFYDKKVSKSIPKVYLIQGSINIKRRNYKCLVDILEKYKNDNFKIRILGKGKELPYLNKFKDKIEFLNNKNFIEYHKFFNDASYILPLIDESYKHEYFSKKYTSSISYGLGYKLPFIAHIKLKKIYPIKGYFYSNLQEFIEIFGKTLELK